MIQLLIVFAGILIVLEVLIVLLTRNLRVMHRERETVGPSFRRVTRSDSFQGFEKLISTYTEGAGVDLVPREVVLLSIVFAALGFLVPIVMNWGTSTALMLAIAGFAALPAWLVIVRRQNLGKFEEQIGAAMPLIASNLRSGLTLRQAIIPVAQNMRDPIKSEFMRLVDEVAAGMSMPDALEAMVERTGSMDLRLFVTAVDIQSSLGGSIAEITDQVGETVRQRGEIRAFVKSKMSMANASSLVMVLVPIIIFAILLGISQTHRAFYTSPSGIAVIIGCLFMGGMGFFIMKMMTKIDD